VKFTEWTLDGLLRNPVYLGIREDKQAEVVRHPDRRPAAASPLKAAPLRRARTSRSPAPAPDPVHGPQLSDLLDALEELERGRKRGTLMLPDGARVPVGNLEKVFWPQSGITKGELLRFYLRMAPFILPVVIDRPLVMKRFPNGALGKSFYQHRAPDPLPEGVRVAAVAERPDRTSTVPYLIGGRLQTLVYMAQLAVISQDPWFSRIPTITEPDHVALDLDPMPGTTYTTVLDVACWLHDELERLGTPSFPKTSGSEGLHIYIPLSCGTPYDAGMIFCQILATVVASRHPKVATIERMVKRRRRGTVYIDYLQNIYGKTLACAYSARASEFAGVSTPLTWKEVHEGAAKGLVPEEFTLRSIFTRLEQVGDLWASLRTSKPADLEAAFAYEET
jgi:bifunctional non-homologous end joining protein LigD